MKNFTLLNNVWMERVNPNLTTEEKLLSREELSLIIKQRSLTSASTEYVQSLQKLLTEHMPEDSQLISVDIVLPTENGLINCVVAGKQKQVRF